MTKMVRVEGRQILRVLQGRLGYRLGTLDGNHANLVDNARHRVTVPIQGIVSPGTFLSICRQAGLEKDDLIRLLTSGSKRGCAS